MRKPIIIRLIIFAVLALGYWLAYTDWLSYVLFYQDQHALFLFTSDYLRERISSAGITAPVNDFLIQFYHLPWFGALIAALLCASVYPLGDTIIRRVTGHPDYAALAVAGSLLVFLSTSGIESKLTLVWLVPLCLLIVWLATLLFRKRGERNARYVYVTAALALVYGAVTCFWLFSNINRSERIMILTEQAAEAGDWDEVLRRADNYLSQGHENTLMTMFRSLALAHKGLLSRHLFDFPMTQGLDNIYLPWKGDARQSEYGYYIYESIGHINEAHRWESEALVAMGSFEPHLANLARYNIMLGRPEAARHFIAPLRHTLFHRAEADSLTAMIDRGAVDGLKYSFATDSAQWRNFVRVDNILPELIEAAHADPANAVAREYMMAGLLLTDNVEAFAREVPQGMSRMPDSWQEALVVFRSNFGAERLAELGLTITPETEARFKKYVAASRSMGPQQLAAEFGNTYWFYNQYISPYTKKSLAK